MLGAAAWPVIGWFGLARAQPSSRAGKPIRVGILRANPPKSPRALDNVFVDALRELGWVEGRNIMYERIYADGDEARLPALAVELMARRPDLIYAHNNPEARAALAATRTIPVVFGAVNDPVNVGIVKSLARPGGNATGVATLGPETGGKRMQLLRETLPKISRVGVLMKPTSESELKFIEQAAGAGVKLIPVRMNEPEGLAAAFAFFAENRAEAVLLAQVAFLVTEHRRIASLSMKQRIPVIAPRSINTESGALMSYNSSLTDHVRRAAHLADKILKGAKPADIPVEQPTKFELVINMKTARALGITIPQSILLQAERVIE
ncbi:MAG: hypothetical protein A3F74_22140 [Betaproteobacteria bacterium RIFCSPLOWO2_12_FULL_62_58]|nr:MAG: hypothetical protein A3F74_22140 [Betaproteobacteria bacterium RIFCSPLOWO2_12_FULL_62_58]